MNCLWMLWRWKLLSTSAIHQLAYSKRSVHGCYVRLLDLEGKDFVISTGSWDQRTIVWHLGDDGYEALATQFKVNVENGFRSENKDHDFWVSAIHLGEWLNGSPEDCANFTEQELKKIALADYPKWVPHTKEHRPDGWWKIGLGKHNKESLIALEVELSKKSPQDYSDVGAFYSNTIDVCQVIWVVRSESYRKYILAHLQKGSSTQACEHSFVLLDHYIQSQWQAQITNGKHQGKKLIEILKAPLQNEDKMFCANFALDVRKYPMISRSPNLADTADLGLSRHY
jgi:hypothetical protein